MADSAIRVLGARTHNLKGIDCRVPHGRLTVVTGPSGAGKSSLAFDTIFAEGQRRFIESMSTYARQFLDQMERPPVDSVEGVQPAVAVEARTTVRSARSTVGTVTEVQDVLRLLFANLGRVHCPNQHGPIQRWTAQEITDRLVAGDGGESFLVVARVARPSGDADRALRELVRLGHARVLTDEGVERLASGATWPEGRETLSLVLGRFARAAARQRLGEVVEEGLRLGHGRIEVHRGSAEAGEAPLHFGRALICTECGAAQPRPVPALFSFDSPLGACRECQGFGRVIGVDTSRVVPDESLSLEQRPIAPWNSPAYQDLYEELLDACRERGIPLDVPWADLSEDDRRWIWSGEGPFVGIEEFFAWLERRNYRVHIRVMLSRYRSYDPCPVCAGTRLKPEALAVRLHGLTVPELTAMSIGRLRDWLASVAWSEAERARSGHLLDELGERVEVLDRVGLLDLLRDLAARGNTVLVVEHERLLVRGADHLIDLGPAAGEQGGEVIAEGTVEEVLANPLSLTAEHLRERSPTAARDHLARRRRERGLGTVAEDLIARPTFGVRGARANNLDNFDLDLPLGAMIVVCGVSGSGKSTLVENVLWANYRRGRGRAEVEPGECDGLIGFDALEDVVLMDQRPLGRSRRSNPVTYLKAYDHIRRMFADTPRARRLGITAGHFSFNIDKGRCGECKGSGEIEVDMQFMAPVTVRCDSCGGRRFQPDVLSVRLLGMSIDELLEVTVAEAAALFAESKGLARKLQCLIDVGLGYLRLGQSTATLSGGEAQRLRLATFLERPGSGRKLFVFDEPTTGLHLSDIEQLLSTLRRLVARGDGVLVVEHSLDLISRADWIVDLGPGAGDNGGKLIYSGPLSDYTGHVDSPTAHELEAFLQAV